MKRVPLKNQKHPHLMKAVFFHQCIAINSVFLGLFIWFFLICGAGSLYGRYVKFFGLSLQSNAGLEIPPCLAL